MRKPRESRHNSRRRRLAALIVPAIGATLVMYFAYYTIDGDRGLKAMTRLQSDIAVSEGTLNTLVAQRTSIEKQVVKLRPDSIDPDLLDERARVVLNFSRPNDLIIHQAQK
jgi:cell division protein FtsB